MEVIQRLYCKATKTFDGIDEKAKDGIELYCKLNDLIKG